MDREVARSVLGLKQNVNRKIKFHKDLLSSARKIRNEMGRGNIVDGKKNYCLVYTGSKNTAK